MQRRLDRLTADLTESRNLLRTALREDVRP